MDDEAYKVGEVAGKVFGTIAVALEAFVTGQASITITMDQTITAKNIMIRFKMDNEVIDDDED